jgi:type II secretion system protein N
MKNQVIEYMSAAKEFLITRKEGVAMAVGLAAFFLFVFSVALYIRFPADRLGPLVEQLVSSALPGADLSIGATRIAFPPGITASGVNVSQMQKGGKRIELARFDSVTITPSLIALVTGGERGSISAEGFNGDINVDLDRDDHSTTVSITIGQIDPGASPLWDQVVWGKLSGELSGEGEYSFAAEDSSKGDGQITATLTKASVTLAQAIAGDMPPVAIDQGNIAISIAKGTATLDTFTLTGPEIEVTLTGTVAINGRVIDNSRLNLTATVKLKGGLQKTVGPMMAMAKPAQNGLTTFTVRGTFHSPSVQ